MTGHVEQIDRFLHTFEKYADVLRHFDGAEPLTSRYLATGAVDDLVRDYETVADETLALRDVGKSVISSWIGDLDGRSGRDEFSLSRVKICHGLGALKMARHATQKSPVMSRTELSILHNGKLKHGPPLLAAYRNGDWQAAVPSRLREHVEYATRSAKHALRLAFVRRYQWQVWIGLGAGPRLSFVTDADGARESFKLRDVPSGKKRRAALLHWVDSHWRQRRTKTKVKAHLRGATEFTQGDWRCRVIPSEYDIDRAESQASQ